MKSAPLSQRGGGTYQKQYLFLEEDIIPKLYTVDGEGFNTTK